MANPTLRDLQAAGSNQYVAWHYAHDYAPSEIYQLLRERFPDASFNTLWAAVAAGRQANVAGEWLTGAGPGDRLAADQVPGQYPGVYGWRYQVIATVLDPSTGTEHTRAIGIVSPANMTRAQLTLAVTESLEAMAQTQTPNRRYAPLPTQFGLVEMQVQAAERWTV